MRGRCCRRRAGSQVGACVREHTGGIGALARVRERTCGSFALYGPAGRTLSILDLLQHRPALSNCSCENQRNSSIQNIRIYIRIAYGEVMMQIIHLNRSCYRTTIRWLQIYDRIEMKGKNRFGKKQITDLAHNNLSEAATYTIVPPRPLLS